VAATLEQAGALPAELVLAVLRRYGRPLEMPPPPPAADDKLVTLDGATLRRVRLRLPVDVIANDWFVLERAGETPLAVPGPLFAAALTAVARQLSEAM
jgi:hypothetical protein